jgi:hypothetical protein
VRFNIKYILKLSFKENLDLATQSLHFFLATSSRKWGAAASPQSGHVFHFTLNPLSLQGWDQVAIFIAPHSFILLFFNSRVKRKWKYFLYHKALKIEQPKAHFRKERCSQSQSFIGSVSHSHKHWVCPASCNQWYPTSATSSHLSLAWTPLSTSDGVLRWWDVPKDRCVRVFDTSRESESWGWKKKKIPLSSDQLLWEEGTFACSVYLQMTVLVSALKHNFISKAPTYV